MSAKRESSRSVCLHDQDPITNTSRYTDAETQGAAASRNVLKASYHTQRPSPYLSAPTLADCLPGSVYPCTPPSYESPGSDWTSAHVQTESGQLPNPGLHLSSSGWGVCLIYIWIETNFIGTPVRDQVYNRGITKGGAQTLDVCRAGKLNYSMILVLLSFNWFVIYYTTCWTENVFILIGLCWDCKVILFIFVFSLSKKMKICVIGTEI